MGEETSTNVVSNDKQEQGPKGQDLAVKGNISNYSYGALDERLDEQSRRATCEEGWRLDGGCIYGARRRASEQTRGVQIKSERRVTETTLRAAAPRTKGEKGTARRRLGCALEETMMGWTGGGWLSG
ncbi:uncharacterized protein CCOS01_15746 [Colletotrichum costaricense]|nr:uncharacterized protein CCOS01_15746 [Colletotrichum costaricense]KAK1509230.1 hypothetical protein CCOS01_15746 [Colletotrichum costaricense]